MVDLKVIIKFGDFDVMIWAWNKAYGFNLNSNLHFCVRGKEETPAIECETDIGAPFVQVTKYGIPELLGILSYGDTCTELRAQNNSSKN